MPETALIKIVATNNFLVWIIVAYLNNINPSYGQRDQVSGRNILIMYNFIDLTGLIAGTAETLMVVQVSKMSELVVSDQVRPRFSQTIWGCGEVNVQER